MSLKIYFLYSHSNFFAENLGDINDKHEEEIPPEYAEY